MTAGYKGVVNAGWRYDKMSAAAAAAAALRRRNRVSKLMVWKFYMAAGYRP